MIYCLLLCHLVVVVVVTDEFFFRLGSGELVDEISHGVSDGVKETVHLLSEIDPRDPQLLSLLWQFARWVLIKSNQEGVKASGLVVVPLRNRFNTPSSRSSLRS